MRSETVVIFCYEYVIFKLITIFLKTNIHWFHLNWSAQNFSSRLIILSFWKSSMNNPMKMAFVVLSPFRFNQIFIIITIFYQTYSSEPIGAVSYIFFLVKSTYFFFSKNLSKKKILNFCMSEKHILCSISSKVHWCQIQTWFEFHYCFLSDPKWDKHETVIYWIFKTTTTRITGRKSQIISWKAHSEIFNWKCINLMGIDFEH